MPPGTIALYDLFPLASHLEPEHRKIAGQFLAAEALWALEEQGLTNGAPAVERFTLPEGWTKDPKEIRNKLVEVGALDLTPQAIQTFADAKKAWDATSSPTPDVTALASTTSHGGDDGEEDDPDSHPDTEPPPPAPATEPPPPAPPTERPPPPTFDENGEPQDTDPGEADGDDGPSDTDPPPPPEASEEAADAASEEAADAATEEAADAASEEAADAASAEPADAKA